MSYITIKEAKRITGLGETTLSKAAHRGAIKGKKVKKAWLLDKHSVEAFRSEHKPHLKPHVVTNRPSTKPKAYSVIGSSEQLCLFSTKELEQMQMEPLETSALTEDVKHDKEAYTWQDLERAYKQGIIKGLSMSYREELN